MKTIKYSLSLGLLLSLASCADDQIVDFKTEKPESIAQYEYLNAYDALKTYIDRSASPDFKLGIALSASDFLKGEMVRTMAISNFDEMTAGNAMKYASCVNDKGDMDFGTVEKFVSAAQAAGITIYGHTLAWHAQQNNKYLNSLIKDKEVEDDGSVKETVVVARDFEDGQHFGGWGGATFAVVPEGPDGSNCWKITNEIAKNFWEVQSALDMPFEAGVLHRLSFKLKGSVSGLLRAGFQNSSNYGSCGDFPAMEVTTDWREISVEVTATEGANRFLFSYGDYAGSLYIDDFAIHTEKSGASVQIPVFVVEDDFSTNNMIGWGNNSTREVNNGVMEITNPSQVNPWEAQAGYDFSESLLEGTTYFLKMNIKGSVEGNIGAAFQRPTDYAGRGDFPSIAITTDWKEIKVSTSCTGDGATRFLFNLGQYAGTIYIDDLSLYWEKSSNSIPLPPEEKKDTLIWAMNNWVEGMMKATAGYVTAWDVVNEAISGGGDNGEGFYPLQSASNVSADDAKNNFYWQDYLGNEDYVRIVVAAARKYYAENGGTAPLKLFINDYNLESDWDDNKKAKSLVHWIKKWEADGVTQIDGIGTQMHVSCYANAATQKSKEDHVVQMFEILAASGKLVKISELDMGYIDENGTSVKTENMTEAQHKAMAEYYKFIVKKYFEIIPAAQQYGITQWCATDAPSDSGWRGGEPVGLWASNYSRKHTYAGFADGLAGK